MLHMLLDLWAVTTVVLAALLVLVIVGQSVAGAVRRLVRGMSAPSQHVARTS